MKIFSFLFIFIILSAHSKDYSYTDLLTLAKNKGVSLEISKSKLNEVDALIKKEKSGYLPKISAVVGSEKRQAKDDSEVKLDNFVTELRVEYNLYNFGATQNKIKSLNSVKESQVKLSQYTETKIDQDLKLQYYSALNLKHQLQILDDEIKFNLELKKQVQLKFSQGLVSKSDVLELDMREATLKEKILQTQEHYQHALDGIRKLTFLSHTDEITLPEIIPHDHFEIKVEDLVAAAYKYNQDLTISQTNVESFKYDLAATQSTRLPSVNIHGRYGKMRVDESYANDSLEGLVGVYIDIPLFDAEKNAQVEIDKIRLAQQKLSFSRDNQNLEIDVIHAYEKMQSIHKQVDLGQLNVEHGLNYFTNVKKEYTKGVKTALDLISARDRLMNFKSDLANSKEAFLTTKIELEKITGLTF